MDRLG